MSDSNYLVDLDTCLDIFGTQSLENSRRWFPRVHTNDERTVMHLALGVAEEGGEVGGVAKKWNRISGNLDDLDLVKLHGEMADNLIYLAELGKFTGIDWVETIRLTLKKCFDRWEVPLDKTVEEAVV